MATSKDDIVYATAQAKQSEDDALRIRYKAGTPLEGGKIADSQPVHLFSAAHNIQSNQQQQKEQRGPGTGRIAESEPVDMYSNAHNIEKQEKGSADINRG
ncbi:hypothetical protein LIER_28859 [Lithospermum erythrorhizon]|uniref:Seed maturation protein n=1 Tax=Lithospermum erythrorhizon TaxID=34254 RepID=A0AAV3RKR1_LITER